ncbi:MAG TPA: transposase [Verrucomicrobiae bacterium]|nr:transposase [Verrucomicrobiae bacterium]
MAIGKRIPKQEEMFISAAQVVSGPGHPFYTKLNQVLAEAGFDEFVEKLCAPYYREGGRPGIPPGVYFRMVLMGYFEGLESQRGIAWRCADSLALRTFLGVSLTEATPVHASMTIIRQRLPESVYDQVFVWVLRLLEDQGLLRGKSVAIDATTLEANAAMKTIVRKDTGENWKEYLQGLAKADGIENPTEEDLRRLDRNRPEKKVSNQVWQSPSDPDSRIAKMKDGRTHLAYKAEHAVDVVTEAIVAATVTFADKSDPQSAPDTLSLAEANLVLAGSPQEIEETIMDKGYHDNGLLADLRQQGVRTYIPERRHKSRRWTDKPEEHQAAFRANRQRLRSQKGRRLNRWRSERCERTFAHVCETGGGRRTWVRGQVNVSKMHTLKCAAYNLGLLLRKVWGFCKPRNARAAGAAWLLGTLALFFLTAVVVPIPTKQLGAWLLGAIGILVVSRWIGPAIRFTRKCRKNRHSLTGC